MKFLTSNTKQNLSALALLSALLIPTQANASTEWKFKISTAGPSWSGTSDSVLYRMYNGGSKIHEYTFNSIPNGWATLTSHTSGGDYTYVQLDAYGNDALWIDYAELEKDFYYEKWGATNTSGWCLSTDSSDCNDSWTPEKRAYGTLKFNTNGFVYGS